MGVPFFSALYQGCPWSNHRGKHNRDERNPANTNNAGPGMADAPTRSDMKNIHRKLVQKVGSVLTALVVVATAQQVNAFSGNDPVNGNPWFHEVMTEKAAIEAGFHKDVADTLGWHADYVDSYLYNIFFWATGGLDRLKAAMSSTEDLEKLHFDDNFSTPEVNTAWRRYLQGTLVGLVWAAERQDVNGARNIVGASLHAIQDFYSHSNWVDDPARRSCTWMETPDYLRNGMSIWTGAYEHGDHLGIIKSHGKLSPACSLMQLPGVGTILDVACLPILPPSNTDMCHTWRSCSVHGRNAEPDKVLQVPVPKGINYFHPAGIALDAPWMSDIAIQVRGLGKSEPELTGQQLFEAAKELAERSSRQWLLRLEEEMAQLGHGGFWNRVKSDTSATSREPEFEHFDRFPYQFLTAGPYPSESEETEWYLRVTLDTADQANAGTDANIRLRAGGKEFLLDYMEEAPPVLEYDDFERGDRQVYTVGPFNHLPTSMELKNDSASFGDIVAEAVEDFINSVVWAARAIRSLALSIISGNADFVATAKKVWTPQQLLALQPGLNPFSLQLDGGGEGKYQLKGSIGRSGGDARETEYIVLLQWLHCEKESDWDRGSGSDEPFLTVAVVPAPGNIQSTMIGPFSDVDSGDDRFMFKMFRFRIPSTYGAIAIAASLYESDDESRGDRRKLHDQFTQRIDQRTAYDRNFSDAVGASLASGWKLDNVHVYAFSRGKTVSAGTVYNQRVNHWLEGGQQRRYTFSARPKTLHVGDLSQATAAEFEAAQGDCGPSSEDMSGCYSNGKPYCGTKSPEGCWCDEACKRYGDCCPDKQAVCD